MSKTDLKIVDEFAGRFADILMRQIDENNMKKVDLLPKSKEADEQAYLYAVMEIRKQCMFAIAAFNNITKKGEGETPLTFSSIHSFLTHSANISKVLWSPKPNPKYPGETLKEVIGQDVADRLRIGGSSPIKDMKVRDGLDHYDARIAKWVKEAVERNKNGNVIPIVDIAIGKKNIPNALYLRHYDPETGVFTFMGEELNLKNLHDEVLMIEDRTGGPLIQIVE